jgi:hypothetical protein
VECISPILARASEGKLRTLECIGGPHVVNCDRNPSLTDHQLKFGLGQIERPSLAAIGVRKPTLPGQEERATLDTEQPFLYFKGE